MGRIRDILRQRFGRLNVGSVALLATLGVVLAAYVASGGAIFSPGDLNGQPRRDVARGGAASHADLTHSCSACHAPAWSGETMADRCLVCHTNVKDQLTSPGPMHGLLEGGMQCSSCHTEHRGGHAALTKPHAVAAFDHDCAAFRLTGAHRALDCTSCHDDGPYQGTPQACAACHEDPPVHKGRFGGDCAHCHSTHTFVTTPSKLTGLTRFNHNLSAFKLTGKHKTADCRSCHKDDATFLGTPQTCVSCHAEPKSHFGRFGVQCQQCHSTHSWDFSATRPDGFNHDLTAFKLTGKHRTIDCQACHVEDTFKGTPTACVACHAEPTIHKGRFSTRCTECHTTHTWGGAAFDHKVFEMNHRGSNNKCTSCHNDGANLKSYTCYNCHHHTPQREAARHARRKVTNLDNCIACHARDKRGMRTALESEELPPVTWTLALPDTACPSGSKGFTPLSPPPALCPVDHISAAPGSFALDHAFEKAPDSGRAFDRHVRVKLAGVGTRSPASKSAPSATGDGERRRISLLSGPFPSSLSLRPMTVRYESVED